MSEGMKSGEPETREKSRKHKGPKRGFLRGNVEAFTVAIVMALVIKTYAFEAFQVPTESMEPTIIGRTPGGDRIIVNKSVYQFRDPERFEVVVFRYPLARMVNYVKRLVGLPDEILRIAHGDLYAKPGGTDTFQVTRKRPELADAIFRENPVIPERDEGTLLATHVRQWWHVPPTRVTIDSDAETIDVDAGQSLLLISTQPGKLVPERRDRYAKDRKGKGDTQLNEVVSDLRLDVTAKPAAGTGAVVLEIEDGTNVFTASDSGYARNTVIRLELAVKGGGARSSLTHRGKPLADPELNQRVAAITLEAGEETELRFENYDDRIRIEIDGDEVLQFDYEQPSEPSEARVPPGDKGPQSVVRFGITNGKASFSSIGLYRDIYYSLYDPAHWDFHVPPGHYLFFGDNSPNSLDARGWRVVAIRLRKGGTVLLGDLEAVSDSFAWPRRDNNPYFDVETEERGGQKIPVGIKDERVHHFLDIHGNEWDLESGSYDILDLNGFPYQDGSPDVLVLHGTSLEDPKPEQIGVEEVTTPKLKELTYPHSPHAFEKYSRLMHFVHRHDIMGQANLIFWPWHRWGVIR